MRNATELDVKNVINGNAPAMHTMFKFVEETGCEYLVHSILVSGGLAELTKTTHVIMQREDNTVLLLPRDRLQALKKPDTTPSKRERKAPKKGTKPEQIVAVSIEKLQVGDHILFSGNLRGTIKEILKKPMHFIVELRGKSYRVIGIQRVMVNSHDIDGKIIGWKEQEKLANQTIKVGDVFEHDTLGQHLLVEISSGSVALFSLKTGKLFGKPVSVLATWDIAPEEFAYFGGNFYRKGD